MYDLEYQGTSFDAEAASWVSSMGLMTSGVKTTQCGSDRLLGGYGVMAGSSYNLGSWSKTYTSLPAHNTIYFKGKFFLIDYWTVTSDHFHIYFDSQNTQMWGIGTSYNYATVNRCGNTYKDLDPMMIYFTVPHTSSSLTFRLANHFTYVSTTQSIGFRDITMTFSTESSAPPKSYCAVTGGYSVGSHACGCGAGTTMSPANSGICGPCDSSCLTCNGAGPADCTSCNPGEYLLDGSCFFCNSTCLTCNGDGPTRCTSCQPPLRLSNGICYECDTSCETCTGPGPTECDSCITSNYLSGGSCYDCDGSCLTCSGPSASECTSCAEDEYLSGGACYPCDDSCQTCNAGSSSSCTSCAFGEYLSSGSCYECHDSCLSCSAAGDSACTACDPSEYLVSGSCYGCHESCLTCDGAGPNLCATCVSKKYMVGTSCYDCEATCGECTGGNFDECTACIEDYYLVGSICYDSCNFPLVKTSNLGVNYCETPCTTSGEYAYSEGGCNSLCDYPRTPITMNTFDVCGFPCENSSIYFYWNGSCVENCPSPLSQDVLGGQNYCDYQCLEDEFLYWNGSCESSCPWPFISETQGIYLPRNFCWFPCESTEYLYWNSSCLTECPYPLEVSIDATGAQFCNNPCGEGSSYYLYSNQSCRSTCPNPLSIIENPGVSYCINPCTADEDTLGYYLCENKTCMSRCLSPFRIRIEPNVQYCDRPCSLPNIFWYRNGTCLPDCKAPYIQSTYSGVVLCLAPCKNSEYFYEYDKECHPKCPSPYKSKYADVIKVCYSDVPISLSETEKIQDAAAGIQSQGDMASGGMKAASAMNSGSPSSALLAGLSSMLQYIRYMKINYPPKVEMLFLVSAGSPISLGFDFEIPESIEKKLADNTLPDVFEKYDINSNFLNNLWDFLMTLLIVLVVIGVLSVLKLAVPEKRYPRTFLVLSKVLGAIRWNVPIMLICSSSGDIFFYASLQIQSSHLDSFSAIICFCVSLLMMIVVFIILVIGFKIMRSFKRQAENPNWVDKWKGYEILYEEYEERSIWSLAYMILFIVRGIIFNLTLANLFNFPLIQCIIINITNILMLGYLLYLRPLKNLLNLVQLFVNEGLVNIIGVSIVILAIMDKAGMNGQSTRVSVGDAIYFVIQTFNTFGLVFMGLGLLMFLVFLYRTWKHLKAQKIISPMEIFKVMVLSEITEQQNIEKDNRSLKRTKIKRPRKKQSIQPQNETNEVIYIDDTVPDLSRGEITINDGLTTSQNFWSNINVLQTEYHEDVSEAQITQPDIQQSFDLPVFGSKFLRNQENSVSCHILSADKSHIMDKTGEIEADQSIEIMKKHNNTSHRSLRNRKLRGRMRPREANPRQILSIEKSQAVTDLSEMVLEMEMKGNHNDNNRRSGFIQDWRRLKDRMNRAGNVTYETDSSAWFKNIKKLKTRLRNNSTTINLTGETESKN